MLEIRTMQTIKGFCGRCRALRPERNHNHVLRFLKGERPSRKLANAIESQDPELWRHPLAKPGIREEYFGEGGIMGRGFGIPGRPPKKVINCQL